MMTLNCYFYNIMVYLLLAGQDPQIRPLVEQDTKSLQRLLPEIPHWVKNPDYDRVCIYCCPALTWQML